MIQRHLAKGNTTTLDDRFLVLFSNVIKKTENLGRTRLSDFIQSNTKISTLIVHGIKKHNNRHYYFDVDFQ